MFLVNYHYLTTPLYYVNDIPHIGSAYTTMVADVMARWQRLQGNSVLLITGTDEHGQKIERTAAAKGLNPQEHCDRIATSFANLWAKLQIQYDRFSRTTAPRHQAIVNEFFERVWEKGDIYLDRQQGWYCVACEEFKEKRELLDNGCCPIHTNLAAEWRDEENYFFRLSKYQTQLEQLYQEQPDFIQPESRRNEVLNFVNQGLQDFSISRVNVAWGFPIPHDGKHTIYVWFDALLGYVTALLDPEDEPTLENALAKWWPIDLHLIGKDILRFHAIYWPAMLMSAGLPLPKRVFGHGFLTKDGRKMVGVQLAQHDVAIGHSKRPAATIAGGAGISPRAFGAHLKTAIPEGADRPAARGNRVNIHHRRAHSDARDLGFKAAFEIARVMAHIGAGAAHVETDQAIVSRRLGRFDHADDAARRTGQDRILALKQAGIGQATVGLHEQKAVADGAHIQGSCDLIDIAAQDRRQIGIDHRRVASPDHFRKPGHLVTG